MDINRAMRAVLKAISYAGFDIQKSYKIERQLLTLGSKFKAKPPGYRTWDRKILSHDQIVPVRIYPPKRGKGARPVLLFFHGGGWVKGNIDTYDTVCTDMARSTWNWVVSVDYRLAPENLFPAGLEDCYAIARELHRKGLAGAAREVTVIGDSAGGNIAAAVSLMAADRGEFTVSRQILIYPAVNNDHGPSSPFPSVHDNGTDYLLTSKRICDYMELYQSKPSDRKNPYFAPLLAENLENQPRTLIITAEYDPLRDEGEAYGDKLRAAGVEVTVHRLRDALHGCLALPSRFGHVKEIHRVIGKFLYDGSGALEKAEKMD